MPVTRSMSDYQELQYLFLKNNSSAIIAPMKKVVYIIPGFKHSPKRKIYKDVGNLFKKKKFDVVYVTIDWKYKTISDWIEQFMKNYYGNNSKKYLFGFSYGAVISLLVSIETTVETQILCSLSPYFKEDLPSLFKTWKKNIGKNRVREFEKLEMAKLAPLVKTRTFLLYGTKEGKFIKKRAKDTFEKLKTEKYLIPVDKAKHDIGNEHYLREIEKVVDRL